MNTVSFRKAQNTSLIDVIVRLLKCSLTRKVKRKKNELTLEMP